MVYFAAMKKILKVSNPNDYAEFVGAPVLHPLVSIVHYDELKIRSSLNNYGVYGLFIQREFPEATTLTWEIRSRTSTTSHTSQPIRSR